MELSNMVIKKIAKEIHKLYVQNSKLNGTVNEAFEVDWEKLPETIQKSNIRQAKSIVEKLDKIDMFILEGENHPSYIRVTSFSDSQIELLAEYEHNLWVQDRLNDGWSYGLVKDIAHKISPYLIPYGSLSDEVKALDRDTIMNILPLLQKVNLFVFRQY